MAGVTKSGELSCLQPGPTFNLLGATAGRRSHRRSPCRQSPSDPSGPQLSGTAPRTLGTAGCSSEKGKEKDVLYVNTNTLAACREGAETSGLDKAQVPVLPQASSSPQRSTAGILLTRGTS